MRFILLIILSKIYLLASLVFFLNFASLNCVSVTGPTTYAIVGSLNKIPTTILGWLLFDSVITGETWFFIAVSMCGGFIYSYAKIKESKQKNEGGFIQLGPYANKCIKRNISMNSNP